MRLARGRNLVTIVIAANQRPLEDGIMKELTNITDQPENEHEESTYALLVRSEEKNRDLLEAAIYPLLIIGAVVAICQFAMQPVKLPAAESGPAPCAVMDMVAKNTVCS